MQVHGVHKRSAVHPPGPVGIHGSDYRLTATEVKETAFRLDGVLVPPQDAPPERPVLFLENQFQTLERFYARWLAAIFLYLYRQEVERPWVAVAVFPTRSVEPHLGPAFMALAPAGLLHRVYLEDLLDQGDGSHLSPGVRLLRLVVLVSLFSASAAVWWPVHAARLVWHWCGTLHTAVGFAITVANDDAHRAVSTASSAVSAVVQSNRVDVVDTDR
jgi:hypothetical protein